MKPIMRERRQSFSLGRNIEGTELGEHQGEKQAKKKILANWKINRGCSKRGGNWGVKSRHLRPEGEGGRGRIPAKVPVRKLGKSTPAGTVSLGRKSEYKQGNLPAPPKMGGGSTRELFEEEGGEARGLQPGQSILAAVG